MSDSISSKPDEDRELTGQPPPRSQALPKAAALPSWDDAPIAKVPASRNQAQEGPQTRAVLEVMRPAMAEEPPPAPPAACPGRWLPPRPRSHRAETSRSCR